MKKKPKSSDAPLLTVEVKPSELLEGWWQLIIVRGRFGTVLPAPIKNVTKANRLAAALESLLLPGVEEMDKQTREFIDTHIVAATQTRVKNTKKFVVKDWMPRVHVRQCTECLELAKEEDWLDAVLYQCTTCENVQMDSRKCENDGRLMARLGDEVCPYCEANVDYHDVLAVADREGKLHEVEE